MGEMKDNVSKEVLRTALLLAAGELSTHKQHEDKHPQTVYEDLIVHALKESGEKPEEHQANIGCATTGELLEELKARAVVDGSIGYRTVDN